MTNTFGNIANAMVRTMDMDASARKLDNNDRVLKSIRDAKAARDAASDDEEKELYELMYQRSIAHARDSFKNA